MLLMIKIKQNCYVSVILQTDKYSNMIDSVLLCWSEPNLKVQYENS